MNEIKKTRPTLALLAKCHNGDVALLRIVNIYDDPLAVVKDEIDRRDRDPENLFFEERYEHFGAWDRSNKPYTVPGFDGCPLCRYPDEVGHRNQVPGHRVIKPTPCDAHKICPLCKTNPISLDSHDLKEYGYCSPCIEPEQKRQNHYDRLDHEYVFGSE